jgi:hypothetical protein
MASCLAMTHEWMVCCIMLGIRVIASLRSNLGYLLNYLVVFCCLDCFVPRNDVRILYVEGVVDGFVPPMEHEWIVCCIVVGIRVIASLRSNLAYLLNYLAVFCCLDCFVPRNDVRILYVEGV